MAGLQNAKREGLPTLEEAQAVVRQYGRNLTNSLNTVKDWAVNPAQNASRVIGEINAMTPKQRSGLAEAATDYWSGFGGTTKNVRNWARDPAATRPYQNLSKTGVKPMQGLSQAELAKRIKPFLGEDGMLLDNSLTPQVEAQIGRIPPQYRRWRYADEFESLGR